MRLQQPILPAADRPAGGRAAARMHALHPGRWRPLLRACLERPGAVHVLRAQPPVKAHPAFVVHQVPSLHLCLAGKARILVPGGGIDLLPGDLVLMEPCAPHRDAMQDAGDLTLHLGFMARSADVSLFAPNDWFIWRLPFAPARERIEAALLAAHAGRREREARALLRLAAEGPLDAIGRRGSPLFNMLWGMWRTAYDCNASPDEVLRKCRLSRSHAYRVFTAAYGMGPGRAIEVMRLDMARWLLLRGCRPGDIARWVGFPTRHAFSKRWIAQFGVPPRACRGRLVALPPAGYASNHRRPVPAHTPGGEPCPRPPAIAPP